jgi:hypothetical protein
VGLSMAERKGITKEMARRYERGSKTEKGLMLDQLAELTGWTRRHARRALWEAIRRREGGPARPTSRPRTYGEDVLEPLKMIWAVLNGPAGKRLAPFMGEIVEVLERTGELEISAQVRTKLLQVSAATIDRMLAPERARLRVKGRSGTKPGTLLKRQIPIRTFAEWDDTSPGFCEVDLVAHDGGDGSGDFCQTLTVTCVNTGWTEVRALRNKAQRWSFQALIDVEGSLPFPLLGLDSDNGSEFINDQLYRYCTGRGITFTRTRPHRKNDNCFVEQKNWPVVRQQVGYARYDTPAELETLGALYAHLRLYVNFFQPQMKLVSKTRRGATVTKRYDVATTPYRRILASAVGDQAKAELTRTYLGLNPLELQRAIGRCQDRLLEIGRTKPARRKEAKPPPDHPFRGAFSPRERWRTFSVRQPMDPSRTY